MKTNRITKHIPWIAAAAVAIVADQLTKLWAVKVLKAIGCIPVLGYAVCFTYVENTGASFGMLKDARWVFMVTSTVLIAAILIFLLTRREIPALPGVSLGMILGGGIGNMIDRVANGFVVDFIDFRIIHFAVFNGADSFICVGAALLFLYILFVEGKKDRDEKGKEKNDAEKPEDPEE